MGIDSPCMYMRQMENIDHSGKDCCFHREVCGNGGLYYEKIDMCLQAKGDSRGHSENGAGYIFIDLYID